MNMKVIFAENFHIFKTIDSLLDEFHYEPA